MIRKLTIYLAFITIALELSVLVFDEFVKNEPSISEQCRIKYSESCSLLHNDIVITLNTVEYVQSTNNYFIHFTLKTKLNTQEFTGKLGSTFTAKDTEVKVFIKEITLSEATFLVENQKP